MLPKGGFSVVWRSWGLQSMFTLHHGHVRPQFILWSRLRWQWQPSPGSPEVWLGLHGFFRLVFLSVLNLTQSWLTCRAFLARCFEASFSCSDTSQLSFQCRASACPRCGCAIQRAVTIPVASSLLCPQRCALCCHRALNSSLPGLSLVNTLVSAWFGNAVAVRWSSSCGWESALQVLPCCAQAMLWVLQRIMFRDWRPEILQLLGPCKSYKGQVHQIPSSWWHVTVGVTPWRCCGRQTLRCAACSQGTCCSWKLDLKLALPLGFCNGTGCYSGTTWILDLERLLIILQM